MAEVLTADLGTCELTCDEASQDVWVPKVTKVCIPFYSLTPVASLGYSAGYFCPENSGVSSNTTDRWCNRVELDLQRVNEGGSNPALQSWKTCAPRLKGRVFKKQELV